MCQNRLRASFFLPLAKMLGQHCLLATSSLPGLHRDQVEIFANNIRSGQCEVIGFVARSRDSAFTVDLGLA